jgi:hypothetical protein
MKIPGIKQQITSTFICSMLLLSMSFAHAQTQVKLQPFLEKVSGMMVNLPCTPEAKKQSVALEDATVTMNLWMCVGKDGLGFHNVYLVSYTDYPDDYGVKSTSELDTFYQASLNGAARNAGGEVTETKVISNGQYRGMQGKIMLKAANASMIMQVFLIGKRVFIVEGITGDDHPEWAELNKVLASFRLKAGLEQFIH